MAIDANIAALAKSQGSMFLDLPVQTNPAKKTRRIRQGSAASTATPSQFCNPETAALMRLSEQAKPLYDEFITHLTDFGFENLHAFITAPHSVATLQAIIEWLENHRTTSMLDGVGDPYEPARARFYLIAWILREAPEQRLRALRQEAGGFPNLIEEIRQHIGGVANDPTYWTWTAIRETIRERLEGSRRAKLGIEMENDVRSAVRRLLARHKLDCSVSDGEIRFGDHKIDIVVTGAAGQLLIPVKSRNTDGGGHSSLYARDVRDSLSSHFADNHLLLPVIIARSWLPDATSNRFIHLRMAPRDPGLPEALDKALEDNIDLFRALT